MPRGGVWPPNSFQEWVVGQNFRGQLQSPAEGPISVLKVELSEDEVSGDEIIAITYPGRRRRAEAAPQTAPVARKVRFDGGRKPLKSAMKKTVSPSESSDTLIDTSDEEDVTTTSEESSDADDSDTSEDEVPIRRRKNKSNKSKVSMCKKETGSDSSAAKDALPHPTCQCHECVRGRKILKAVIKFEAKQTATEQQSKDNGKENNKGGNNDASSAGTSTEATDTTDASATEPETTEPETTEPEATDDETPPKKGKKQKQKQKQKQEQKQKSPQKEKAEPAPQVEEPKKAVNKEAWKMPTYPKEMQPNWVMPPRTKVMRIEHTIENENDPRPNAFFDSTKGITRVYHGPVFGNHMGELYGNYNAENIKPPGYGPPGWPPIWHRSPHHSPRFLPGPPQGWSFGQNMPPMNVQMPSDEAAMREAASKGFGLSGMPAPPPPPMNSEAGQKHASQKAGSDKASKSNGWGGAADFNTGGTNQGWGDNNNAWGTGADLVAGGGGSGSKKDGVSSPANFAAFGHNNGEKFERRSNKSGSQNNGSNKNGSQKNGNGASWSPAKNQDTSWGQGNTTTNNNNDTNGHGGNTWDNSWGNGEKKQSPSGSHAPLQSKPPSATNGTPGNGGNTIWDGNNDTQGNAWSGQQDGWGAQGNAWPGAGDSGSKKNTPQQNSSFHDAKPDAWGGPPGSKPPSNRGSQAGSKSGWHDNKNGNFNGNAGMSYRNSPQFKGAFSWPAGQGSPPRMNNGGYANNNWGHTYGSRANSHSGDQKGGPSQSTWQDVPNQATGPSQTDSWKNPQIAQHTGGKADQW